VKLENQFFVFFFLFFFCTSFRERVLPWRLTMLLKRGWCYWVVLGGGQGKGACGERVEGGGKRGREKREREKGKGRVKE